MNRTYTTSQGTELPILNLRGKDYLEVKYRLVWFREDHPSWSIETELVSVTDKSACAKATVKEEQGRIIATSHKFETERGFPDFIEKAETGAIGRALALIGYGTQFCADELDEGQRIVDSPVNRPGDEYSQPQSPIESVTGGAMEVESSGEPTGLRVEPKTITKSTVGDFEIHFGKKYRGKKLRDVPKTEIESYLTWLESSAEKKNIPVSYDVKVLKKAFDLFYGEPSEGAA